MEDSACIVSIIPINKEGITVDFDGFKYGAKETNIEYGSSLGISNSLSGEKGKIKLKRGKALVIKTWEVNSE